MEYFRAPAFCHRTRVMTDPGGIVCLCGKSLDLHRAWQQGMPGADSQCVHCRRCYDSRAQLISARRQPGRQHLPQAPQQLHGAVAAGVRSRQLWRESALPAWRAAAPLCSASATDSSSADPVQRAS